MQLWHFNILVMLFNCICSRGRGNYEHVRGGSNKKLLSIGNSQKCALKKTVLYFKYYNKREVLLTNSFCITISQNSTIAFSQSQIIHYRMPPRYIFSQWASHFSIAKEINFRNWEQCLATKLKLHWNSILITVFINIMQVYISFTHIIVASGKVSQDSNLLV